MQSGYYTFIPKGSDAKGQTLQSWSLTPKPTNSDYVKNTPILGFQTILNRNQLFNNCKELVTNDMNYFSSMISKLKHGEIIRIAS